MPVESIARPFRETAKCLFPENAPAKQTYRFFEDDANDWLPRSTFDHQEFLAVDKTDKDQEAKEATKMVDDEQEQLRQKTLQEFSRKSLLPIPRSRLSKHLCPRSQWMNLCPRSRLMNANLRHWWRLTTARILMAWMWRKRMRTLTTPVFLEPPMFIEE